MDPELHTLRREKNALLEEVARLKQEHLQTIEQMSTLNHRLESAEDRQRQMVSFLAKLLQNPSFVRKLKLHREKKEIDSTRVKRKFLKHVPHGSVESGESSSQHAGESGSYFAVSSPMATTTSVHDDITELQNFLLEDDDLNFGMDSENTGLEGTDAADDIGELIQGFDTQEELDLGSGAELLEMPPASGPLARDPTIGRFKGKNVLCPGLDATSSEGDCLSPLPDNMGLLSGTMLGTAGSMMAADDEQIWGVDASAALQSSCSGTSQQAFGSHASDPYLMDIANRPERFWELDFQALDEADLQLDKCAIDDPALQQQTSMKKP